MGNGAILTTRVVLAAAGLAAAAYGLVTLWGLGGDNLLSALPWLLGGVVLHDAVLAPRRSAGSGRDPTMPPSWTARMPRGGRPWPH
jgi:hypothetical protein